MDQPPPYDEAIHYPTPPGQGKYQKFTQFLRYYTSKKIVQLSVMIYAMICPDLASCEVECGNFHQAESCKKCVENESPMIKMLMPYSWCGGECKWEPVMGLCIGKHT